MAVKMKDENPHQRQRASNPKFIFRHDPLGSEGLTLPLIWAAAALIPPSLEEQAEERIAAGTQDGWFSPYLLDKGQEQAFGTICLSFPQTLVGANDDNIVPRDPFGGEAWFTTEPSASSP